MLQNPLRLNPYDDEGLILIEQEVIDKIHSFRQVENDSSEAGGILLGFRRGFHLHITDLTLPSMEDRRTRTTFYRSAVSHQKIAMARWLESNGTMGYLGEWHTHPQMAPTPSTIDIREWKYILSNTSQAMIFIIAGIEDQNWIGIGMGLNIVEVSPIKY